MQFTATFSLLFSNALGKGDKHCKVLRMYLELGWFGMEGAVPSLSNALFAGPAHLPQPSARLVQITGFELISTNKWCASFRVEKGHWIFSWGLSRGRNMPSLFALTSQGKGVFWYEVLSLKLLAAVWISLASRDVLCLSQCFRGVLYHCAPTHKLWLKATLDFMVGAYNIILVSQITCLLAI